MGLGVRLSTLKKYELCSFHALGIFISLVYQLASDIGFQTRKRHGSRDSFIDLAMTALLHCKYKGARNTSAPLPLISGSGCVTEDYQLIKQKFRETGPCFFFVLFFFFCKILPANRGEYKTGGSRTLYKVLQSKGVFT